MGRQTNEPQFSGCGSFVGKRHNAFRRKAKPPVNRCTWTLGLTDWWIGVSLFESPLFGIISSSRGVVSFMSLNIAIGSDHHGVPVRIKLVELLRKSGHVVNEVGPAIDAQYPTDYPDVAAIVAQCISTGEANRGILICGTGIGMCIAANKFPGVRAAPVIDELSAEFCRRHNDLNVLCIANDTLSEEHIFQIVHIWLNTPFDGGRHERRIEKIRSIEHSLGMC